GCRVTETDLEFHEAANLFPLLEGKEFDEVVADISTETLKETIKLLGGKILDGRNRYRACKIAGVEPRFEDLPTGTNPLRYVVSVNLPRRTDLEPRLNFDEVPANLPEPPPISQADAAPFGENNSANLPSCFPLPISQAEAARMVRAGRQICRPAPIIRQICRM